jgi:hypothetical protein
MIAPRRAVVVSLNAALLDISTVEMCPTDGLGLEIR